MTQNKPAIEDSIRFVATHYTEGVFDSVKGWKKITPSLPDFGRKKHHRLRGIYAVAAVALLFVIGFGIYKMANQAERIQAVHDNMHFILPDKTEIVMRKGANLSYNKDFQQSQRLVSMLGEITYSVARDESRPFTITTPVSHIEVLGTVFTVDAGYTETSLIVTKGIVKFTPEDPVIPILCTAGMRLHYNAENQTINVFSKDREMEIDGKNGAIRFDNIKLEEVVMVLSHYYNVDISLPENETELTFSSSFTQKDIEEIINIINITLNSHITIEK